MEDDPLSYSFIATRDPKTRSMGEISHYTGPSRSCKGFENKFPRDLTHSTVLRLFNLQLHSLLKFAHEYSDRFMHELTIQGVGTFEVEEGTRLVRAIEEAGVDIGHRCGGQSQCTTCRVKFKEGEPGVMTEAEHEKLTDIDQFGEMRLSCQIVVDRDMVVEPLMTVDDQGWDDAGPDPSITVEPAPEWHPIETLDAADSANE